MWAIACIPSVAHAQVAEGGPPADAAQADEQQQLGALPGDPHIIVYGRALEQIGEAQSGSQGTVGYRDFENRPVSRVGELVENVPGVIATQHSGTGKANQYFLRGFNLDHGTDFAGFVDGVPINMRTHGHGQGYLDFNFLIPELVERIDYRKGPYFADVGDFSAAGTVSFRTVDRLAQPLVEGTIGSNGYYRGLAAGSVGIGNGDLLLALDGTLSDGPWDLDEDFRKLTGAIKLTTGGKSDRLSIGLTGYHATWNSSDQVPRRAIDSGLIGRFGYIDPDLGGRTSRVGLTAQLQRGATALTAYALHYDFRLLSNFTYFLDDPINGDEFEQIDRRQVYGGAVDHAFALSLAELPLKLSIGGDLRYDDIAKVGLFRTAAAKRLATVRQDAVEEFSAGIYASAQLQLTPTLRATLGLRGDYYAFDVAADLPANGGKGRDAIATPKAALAWRLTDDIELYANYGESFHSNDVRGATIAIDPVSSDPTEAVPVLVRARGGELGARIESGALTASLVGYHLTLGSELVFVGDAGTTEPNDGSRRYGTEATLFWRPARWLTLDGSASLTAARFRGVAKGQNHIPGAVTNVIAGGATADLGAIAASVRLRHFGSAPLVEDNSVRSEPTTLVNVGVYYRMGPARFSLDLFNAFNAKDADITYFYASRLPGEPAEGVDDYHLHPVEPRQIRLAARWNF